MPSHNEQPNYRKTERPRSGSSVVRYFGFSLFLLCVGASVRPCVGQAQVPADALILRGLDFERQGRNEDAVNAFKQVLAREPANSQALLGAERVYTQLGRRDSIMAMANRALTADRLNNTAWI